jgi:hypothetical protein
MVTLKDGTCRVGPWEDGLPVGDWHSHTIRHSHPMPNTLPGTPDTTHILNVRNMAAGKGRKKSQLLQVQA